MKKFILLLAFSTLGTCYCDGGRQEEAPLKSISEVMELKEISPDTWLKLNYIKKIHGIVHDKKRLWNLFTPEFYKSQEREMTLKETYEDPAKSEVYKLYEEVYSKKEKPLHSLENALIKESNKLLEFDAKLSNQKDLRKLENELRISNYKVVLQYISDLRSVIKEKQNNLKLAIKKTRQSSDYKQESLSMDDWAKYKKKFRKIEERLKRTKEKLKEEHGDDIFDKEWEKFEARSQRDHKDFEKRYKKELEEIERISNKESLGFRDLDARQKKLRSDIDKRAQQMQSDFDKQKQRIEKQLEEQKAEKRYYDRLRK